MSAVRAAPPPSGLAPSSAPPSKNKRKKNKKGKKASDVVEALHDEDEDDDEPPLLEDLDSAQRSNFVNPPATNGSATLSLSTPSDLLSTASDLYRQIEAAAASALSTHPSFAASFPPPPAGTGAATDEAYWTSLPQHLRQFIRSALPLAAGLTSPAGSNGSLGIGVGVTGVNGQSLPPLTHEQLSSAAAQLAQVVQSNWGQLGLGPIPPGAQAQLGNVTAAGNGTSRGATISLGSFPVTMPTREQMEAAIGSIGGMELGGGLRLEEENVFDLTEDEDSKEGEETGSKKKNKKKKKKNAAVAVEAPTVVPTPPTPVISPDSGRQRQTARRAPFTTPPTAAPRQPPPKSAPAPPTTNINGKNRAADPPAPSPPAPQSIAAGKQPQYAVDSPPASRPAAPTVPQPSVPTQQRFAQTPSIAPKPGPSSERERIRDFWLGLKEGERRALVKVEKEAVLRKMKEQQRSGCSCAVCGRKRTAIEEELEVLYDAYYDELESYANHQVRYASSGGTIAPPPGPGPFPGSVDAAAIAPPVQAVKKAGAIVKTTRDHKNVRPAAKKKLNNAVSKPPPVHNHTHHEGPAHGEPGHTHSPSCPHHPHNHSHTTPATTAAKAKGAAVEQETYDDEEEDEEEEEDDGEYDEDEYDEEEEDEEQYDEDAQDLQANDEPKKGTGKRGDSGADFFGFGKSLTVKGGILTVADDLLKNDGQKFLEMMEQLADKRIQREQSESIVEIESDEGSEDGEYDEDDEDDDDEIDEDDDEDEEVMTEAERMEEGRRMFQIFAARMFEQRVLAAYRHKVATERQEQLLRELEEEERLAEEKELKKAKENQKKKDKKKDQKQKKEEDRLRKEAEKDALEEAQRTAEAARQEEERRRNEEQRAKREVEKKLKEEERQRVSEEKRKRTEEEAKRRKEREEKLRVEKEARLAKEKDEREKKAKDDAERKARELAERIEREEKQEKDRIEKEKAEAEAKVQAEKDRLARTAQAAATAAARIKAQSAKSTPAPRQQPIKAIPGLPKPTAKPVPLPSSIARPPHLSLPPGVIPRQPSGMQQAPTQQHSQIPPSRSHQVPYGQPRAPTMPLVQQVPSGGVPPASSRSFGPAGGFGAPHQPQTSSFVAHPQTQHSIGQVSPVLARAPIGPPPPLPSTSIPLVSSNGGPSPRQNGFAPIGPPPTLVQPPLGLSSPTPRPTGIISPIGRPSSVSTANNSFSGPTSLRSTSPPPRVFGSSALFEDDEVVQSSSRGAGGPASWSSPFGSIWSPAQAPPPPPPPDRLSVIRDRARVTHLRLDASGGPVPINDLHRTLVTLWPDSSSVDLRELVEAMLIAGTGGNGGGTFVFSQRGEGLVVVFAS